MTTLVKGTCKRETKAHILCRKLLQNETHLPALRLHYIQKRPAKEIKETCKRDMQKRSHILSRKLLQNETHLRHCACIIYKRNLWKNLVKKKKKRQKKKKKKKNTRQTRRAIGRRNSKSRSALVPKANQTWPAQQNTFWVEWARVTSPGPRARVVVCAHVANAWRGLFYLCE